MIGLEPGEPFALLTARQIERQPGGLHGSMNVLAEFADRHVDGGADRLCVTLGLGLFKLGEGFPPLRLVVREGVLLIGVESENERQKQDGENVHG